MVNNGIAKGLDDSVLNSGSGNEITINTEGSWKAFGLENSSLDSGSGDDTISLSAKATALLVRQLG